MAQYSERTPRPLRVLVMSSYVPRECGIATYAEDVIHAIEPYGATCDVLAMERRGQPFIYEPRVVGTVEEDNLNSYLAAANLVNRGGYDVLSLQHEFGIYGGDEAEYLMHFLRAVRIPVVVTFHTIMHAPLPAMQRVQSAICQRADAIVVMNGLIPEVLGSVYHTETRKVQVIHHGAPVPHRERGAAIKHELGMDDQYVLSTFGLLNRSKGLEHMVNAMPEIVQAHPHAVYYILGQTHPVMREEEGESYRDSLAAHAQELGVGEHVRFINKYLTKEDLVTYLLATDTYVTPYVNMEQVTSGTLAYAMGSGCPIIATPYLHAQFLLSDGRGMIVPMQDAAALAGAAKTMITDTAFRQRMEAGNWAYGKTLYWPRIGAEYFMVFRQAAASGSM